MFNFIHKLFGPGLRARTQPTSTWDRQLFVYVKIPGDIQPLARGERFEDPIQLALAETGLGEISGGGSQMDDPYPDGRPRVEFSGIDVTVTDQDSARNLIMKQLSVLAAPNGTEIHYTKGDAMLLDRLVDGAWVEGEPRTFEHPGFGG